MPNIQVLGFINAILTTLLEIANVFSVANANPTKVFIDSKLYMVGME